MSQENLGCPYAPGIWNNARTLKPVAFGLARATAWSLLAGRIARTSNP